MTDTPKYTHAEIRKLLEAITPGEWKADGMGMFVTARDGQMKVADIRGWGYLTGRGCGLGLSEEAATAIQVANSELIAAAPAVVRQLLEEVERLRAELDRLKAEPLVYLTRSDYEAMRFKADKADALAAAAEEALAAMEMQLARECGEAHIPQSTARHIWDSAAGATSDALKAWRGEGE